MINYQELAAELLALVPNPDSGILQQATGDYCAGLADQLPGLDADLLYDAAMKLLDNRQAVDKQFGTLDGR